MIEYKICVQNTEGKELVASFGWVKQQLGVCETERRLNALERKVQRLERPQRQKAILRILRTEGPRTNYYLSRYVMDFSYDDLWGLMQENKVTTEKHGKTTLYKVGGGSKQ